MINVNDVNDVNDVKGNSINCYCLKMKIKTSYKNIYGLLINFLWVHARLLA